MDGKKFAAFISYRHHGPDQQIAHALHRLLEGYRAPASLQNRCVGTVFLDDYELPLSSDLGNQITTALDQSEFLILICSNIYTDSLYCKAELDYFLRIHQQKTDRVLVVLAQGEPQDVFPQPLRTTLAAEAAQSEAIFQLVEPLGADVRGPNIQASMKRLRREYLRIVAPLLGCGYDDLVRRHLRRKRRRMMLAATAFLLLAGGLTAFGILSDQQIQQQVQAKKTQQADVILNRVDALLSADLGWQADEQQALVLASAYAQNPDLADQPAIQHAFLNAAMQSLFNENTHAFPRCLYTDYPYEEASVSNGVFYYIAPADTILFADHAAAKETLLIDAKTGAVLENFGECKLTISHNGHYLLAYRNIRSEVSNAIAQTVTLWDLYRNQQIISREFRNLEADSDITTAADSDEGPFAIYDGQTFIYGLDSTGAEISEADFVKSAAQTVEDLKVPRQTPYTILQKHSAAEVRDAQGNPCLTLPKSTSQYVFSDDYALFAYAANQEIHVLDTADWTETARLSWGKSESLLSLSFLKADSRLMCLLLRKADAEPNSDSNYVRVFDLKTGVCVLKDEPGTPPEDQAGSRFYLCAQGKLSAFQFYSAYLDEIAPVTALSARYGTALAANDAQTRLMEADTGAVLCAWKPDQLLTFTEDLSRLLVYEAPGLYCYGAAGNVLWKTEVGAAVRYAALSEDGERAAYAADSQVWLADADGSVLAQYTLPFAPRYLAVSGDTVYAASGDQGSLLSGGTMTPLDGSLPFGEGRFADQMLILWDPGQANLNFAVCSLTGEVLYQPEDSVDSYRYSTDTHLLALHPLSLDSRPYPTLLILKNHGGVFQAATSITLENPYDTCEFDETGEHLTVTGDEGTTVYRTADWMSILAIHNASGRYLGQRLYATVATGAGVFSQAMDPDALLAYAMQRLTSVHGERTLTKQENPFTNEGGNQE